MNRKGVALVLAVLSTGLAALLVSAALAVAETELRSGLAWSRGLRLDHQAESVLAWVTVRPPAVLDSLLPGEETTLLRDSVGSVRTSVIATRLGDSLLIVVGLASEGVSGGRRLALLVRQVADSTRLGGFRLVPIRERARMTLKP
jgi:hypothetical protein